MKINKQLLEDVFSGKLKGTFVLRNGKTFNSKRLKRVEDTFLNRNYCYPYALIDYINDGTLFIAHYTENGIWSRRQGVSSLDIVDFIPDAIEIDPEIYYSYSAKDIQFIEHFIKGYHMKENELTIEIPDNKVVDWDESKKQNKIVLKDRQLTYEEICDRLPGIIDIPLFNTPSEDGNALVANEHQLECILAKNKLANVAKYLNDGWKPDKGGHVFVITYYGDVNPVLIVADYYFRNGENLILFKTQKVAQQAIEILGEETVKLALEPLGI